MSGLLSWVKRHALPLRIGSVAVTGLVGGLAFGLGASGGGRAAASFVGGLVLVALAFEFGKFNIRLAARILPSLSLAIAMLSYVTTVVALGVVLAASSPRVVDGRPVAVGLMVGVLIWLAGEIAEAWVVQEHL